MLDPKTDLRVAVILLVAWAASGTLRYGNTWPIDLSALWMAGRLWDLGLVAHLYEAPTRMFSWDFPPVWVAELEAAGHGDKMALPFVYPPLWSWALSHFGQVDPLVFFNIGKALLFAAIAAAVLLLWRLAGAPRYPAWLFVVVCVAIAETTFPFYFAGILGQPQLLLTFLMVLSFERYAAGAHRAAALALGVAAAIKVTPVILVLVFLAERDWRTPLMTLAVAACLAVLSFAVAGLDPHLAFLERVAALNGLAVMIGLNVNFEAVMHTLFVSPDLRAHLPHPWVGDDVGWISLLNTAGLVVAMTVSLRAAAGLGMRGRLVVRLLLVTLATLLFGPLSWAHYYTLPMMILPLLPLYLGTPRAILAALPAGVIMAMPVSLGQGPPTVAGGLYPTGYWMAFLWLFVLVALGPRDRERVQTLSVAAE